jgi:hypothetical protein
VGLIETLLERIFPPEPEPLGAIRPGLRRLTARGRVIARDTIQSPLGGVRCVYYRYLVEEWRPASMNVGGAGLWNCAEHDEAIAEFYLDDESGRALVEPARARVETYLEHRGADGDRRAREWLIQDGDRVEIRGAVADELTDLLDGERGYRDPSSRLVLRAPERGWLTIRVLGR